jgi:hypothetical protein
MEPFSKGDILGIDPEYTTYILSSLKTTISQGFPQKRTAIPLGLVKCMFRTSFSVNFRGRFSQKFLKMILERIAANKKIGCYGKNSSLIGGIYKKSVAHYRGIPPVNFKSLPMMETHLLIKHTVSPPIGAFEILTQFDLTQPILFDHIPVFVHLLKRLIGDLKIMMQIHLNRKHYRDDFSDCPASYCYADSTYELEMANVSFLENEISTALKNFESRFREFPYSRLKLLN